MAISLSVVHPSTLRHFFSRTFCSPRPFDSASSAVSINCIFSSSSSATMNSFKTMKSISTQTNNTVSSLNPHSLKAALFKTLALKIGNEFNHGTISPTTRQAFSKIMYNVFLLSSKKIPFEQYYRFLVFGPTIAICETKSNNVFVLTHTSFDLNNFYFCTCFSRSRRCFQRRHERFWFFFKNWLCTILANTRPNATLLLIRKTSNLVCCNAPSSTLLQSSPIFNTSCCSLHPSSTSLVAVFTHLQLLFVAVFIPLQLLLATVLPSCRFFTMNLFNVQ